jgi:hypothetical protein
MNPTRVHYFYAQNWPMRIWFVLVTCGTTAASTAYCVPLLTAVGGWRSVVLLGGIVIVSLLLGFFGSLLLAWPVLGTLYYGRETKNGGPFKGGDVVRVLAHPHRGRVAHVYSLWQGDTVRVDLGEEAKREFKDIYHPWQLLREERPAAGAGQADHWAGGENANGSC